MERWVAKINCRFKLTGQGQKHFRYLGKVIRRRHWRVKGLHVRVCQCEWENRTRLPNIIFVHCRVSSDWKG